MKRLILLWGLLLLSAEAASAQFDTSPQNRNGRHPFAAYFDADIDTVDLYNGNLMLDIDLFSLPGRGLSTGLRVSYNARRWQPNWNNTIGFYTGGWRIHMATGFATVSMNLESCQDEVGYWRPTGYWIDEVWIYRNYYGDLVEATCDQESPPYQNLYLWALNGDGSFLTTGSSGPDDLKLTFKDGSIIDMNGSSGKFVTTNGNYLERDYNSGMAVQDTLGRTISYSTDRGNSTTPLCDFTYTSPVDYYKTYTITDSNNNSKVYTLNFHKNRFVHNPIEHCWEHLDDWLTSIVLPDNMGTYTFHYETFQGYLTKVELPSGAYIEYDYYGGHQSETAGHDYIIKRRVNDGTTSREWTYETTELGGNARTVTVTSPEGHQASHQFNSSGQETAVQYRNSSSESPVHVVSTEWSNGRPTITYTATTSGVKQTTTTWDSNSDITQQEHSDWGPGGGPFPKRSRTTYTYTSSYVPRRVSMIEVEEWTGSAYALKGKTEFEYDEDTVAATDSSVPNKTTPPGDRWNVTTIRRYKDSSNSVEERFYYNDLGQLIEAVDPLGHSTTFDYTDNFTNTTHNGYKYAFLKKVTNELGHSYATNKYDYNTGLLMSVLDTRTSQQTTMTYDLLNRIKTITEPKHSSSESSGRVTTYTYTDSTPKVTEEVLVASGKTRKTETILDKLYRPLKVTLFDPDGNVSVDTEYDGNGRIKKVSQPYRGSSPSAWTETVYDGLNRPTQVTNPDSTQVEVAYDGAVVTTTDELGRQRRLTHNAVGQLIKVEELDPAQSTPTLSNALVTEYAYEIFGPLKEVTQGAQTRTFTHDWLGRMTQTEHPESGSTSYVYDAAGRLDYRTDARNITADYEYDAINRVTEIDYSDSTPDVTYCYEACGITGFLNEVVVKELPNGPVITQSEFEYLDTGLLKKETVSMGGVTGDFVTEYAYDYDGRLLTAKYPSGRIVTRTYDSGSSASDRLEKLGHKLDPSPSVEPQWLVQSIQDNAAGLITGRTLSTGIVENRAFNVRNQLTRITAAAGGTTLMDLGYGYGTNNNGRIRSRTDAVQPEHSASYAFDELDRLEAVSGGDSSWGLSWVLDRYGNRTSQTPSGLATNPVGSQSNAISASTNRDGDWTYDDAGNVTNDGNNIYTYDAESRLIQVDSSAIQYAYDAAGRRVKKYVSNGETAVTTYYFYGLTGLMSEFSTSTALSSATAAASTDRIQYRIGEQTGTPVMLVASDGTPRENNRVFPFGEPWDTITGSNNDQKFTTYQRDGESDLDYAMARSYAHRSGRFMTPDPGHVGASPTNPQSWNAYVYALNDPINGVDPLGLVVQRVFDPSVCDLGSGTLIAIYIGVFDFWDPSTNTLTTGTRINGEQVVTGYDCDFPDSVVTDNELGQGQGGRGEENPNVVQRDFSRAFDRAITALTHPDTRRRCGGIFNGRDPVAVLRDLMEGTTQNRRFGRFNFFAFGGDLANETEAVYSVNQGNQIVGYVIGINTRVNTFFGRERTRQAATIIHALGHYYVRAFGAGTSLIVTPDLGDPEASFNNTEMVLNRCDLR